MIPARVFHYRDPASVLIGLGELHKRGLTSRGLLFVALDPRGETHIAIPEDLDAVTSLRVGRKMTLEAPFEGRYFHFDAIHSLPGETVLWNGDRRLGDTGSAPEVACAVAGFLQQAGTKSVFLGCTPHQPGTWWTRDERSSVVDLHASGLVNAVVTPSGLLARRMGEPGLWHLDFETLHDTGARDGWKEIYRSSLGNILVLERSVMNYRLVLACEEGLIEIDTSGIPDEVREVDSVKGVKNIGVVGRINGEGFAVTRGKTEDLASLVAALPERRGPDRDED
jgi:hypothetical protein